MEAFNTGVYSKIGTSSVQQIHDVTLSLLKVSL